MLRWYAMDHIVAGGRAAPVGYRRCGDELLGSPGDDVILVQACWSTARWCSSCHRRVPAAQGPS